MSKADEMFDELGYENLTDEDDEFINYSKILIPMKSEINIIIHLSKKIECTHTYYDSYGILQHKPYGIDIKELQAINEKCKELKWN